MTRIDGSDTFTGAFDLSVTEKDGTVLTTHEKLGWTCSRVVLEADAAVQDTVAFVQHRTAKKVTYHFKRHADCKIARARCC